MLNADTKRHIDAARDVLVGVAPNPMTQIDQITYALIYKFMDDMDQAAIKAGGEPSFFIGELEAYAWSKLVDSRMGNQEKMNLYGEALQKFAEAKQLPELFRTIFRAGTFPQRDQLL
jgi:type I restriction enzyme M protein